MLDERCREIGRDPAGIERSVNVEVEDTRDAATLDAFRAAGATHLIVRFGEPWDFGAVERLVAWRDSKGGGLKIEDRRLQIEDGLKTGYALRRRQPIPLLIVSAQPASAIFNQFTRPNLCPWRTLRARAHR